MFFFFLTLNGTHRMYKIYLGFRRFINTITGIGLKLKHSKVI